MRFFPTLFFSLILFCSSVRAQNAAFEHLSLEDGLSQSTVEAIVQDHQGLLWFGTNDGLNRYDGYEIVVYRNDSGDPNSISDNYIHSMCVDDSGSIWIGTNKGLNRFEPLIRQFTRYLHDPSSPGSISHDIVTSVCIDAGGRVWAGTFGGGLNLYDRQQNRFIRFKHDSLARGSLSDDRVLRLKPADNGDLWVGTFYGWINRIHRDVLSSLDMNQDVDARSVSFEHFFILPDTTPGAQEEFVWALETDGDDRIWVGTHRNGLFHLDASARRTINYRTESHPDIIGSNSVQSLLNDSDGHLWIGSDIAGLRQLDIGAKRTRTYRHEPGEPRSLSDNSIWSLFSDHSGVLWIGTDFGGINILDPHRFTFVHYPARAGQLEDNQIWTFWEDLDGIIWIGTDGGGLTSFDPRDQSFKNTLRHNRDNTGSLSNDFVLSMSEEANGRIWVGTAGGLNLLEPRTAKVTRIPYSKIMSRAPNEIRALSGSRTGNLWVGTYGSGLFLFDPKDLSFTPIPNSIDGEITAPSFVNCLLEEPSGVVWFGTLGEGLFMYNHRSGNLETFSTIPADTSSLPNNKINTLYLDRNENLWVGTFGGLCRYDRSSRIFTRYTTKDGLPNDVIYGILEDESGHLWLSTNRGVSRFDPTTEYFTNFTLSDGLQSYEFNRGAALRSSDGQMYFGGINGFNMFRPSQIILDKTPPPVTITSFRIMNREQNLGLLLKSGGMVVLGPGVTDFSFEFAALDYTNSEKNQYAYRMDGINDDWISIGTRRSASFSLLPAGEYTFRVKGTNSDGFWNEAGVSVPIRVLPPFWSTWWFQAMAALSLLAIATTFYRLRMSTMEKEKLAQQETSRKLIESQEEERRRIASGLHDSLGQNLLILKTSIEQAFSRHQLPREVARELKDLSGLADEALNEVREISFDLHPHVLDRLGLSRAIETIAGKVSQVSPIEVRTSLCETDRLLEKDMEINLYRIIQESLSNVVKHSNASEAAVRLTNRNGELRLEVEDNGRGFDADHILTRPARERSLGLIDIAERTRLLGGKYNYRSSPGDGTVLTVVIPISMSGTS